MWTKRTKLVLAVISRSVDHPGGKVGLIFTSWRVLISCLTWPHTGIASLEHHPTNSGGKWATNSCSFIFKNKNKRQGGQLHRQWLVFCAHSLMPIKFYQQFQRVFIKGVTACPPVNEKSSPVQWFCVSGCWPPPSTPSPHSFVDHIYTHCVCCIDPPRHQLGAFNACILKCALCAEWACVQFADPLASRPLCSLTLRMCTLLRCECNL